MTNRGGERPGLGYWRRRFSSAVSLSASALRCSASTRISSALPLSVLVTTLRRRSALTFTLGTPRTIAGGYLAGTPRDPLPVTFEKLRVFFSQGPKLDFHSGNAMS